MAVKRAFFLIASIWMTFAKSVVAKKSLVIERLKKVLSMISQLKKL